MNANTRRKLLKKNSKKGSYILEATIIVPIFILGVLVLMSVVDVIRTCDSINYSLCDEFTKLQGESIYMPLTVGKTNDIEERVKNDEVVTKFDVDDFRYLYSADGKKDLIKITTKAVFDSKAVLDINENIIFNENIVGRAFTGLVKNNTKLSEEDFLKDDDYEEVYVFPNEGTKYHKANCSYVASKPFQCVLTDQIKKKYSPCKICKSSQLNVGSLVCCYKYGGAYHCLDCETIEKYVIKMDKQEAIKKGYTPCSKCFGGGK